MYILANIFHPSKGGKGIKLNTPVIKFIITSNWNMINPQSALPARSGKSTKMFDPAPPLNTISYPIAFSD
ncbi:MAG: hypothetical protein K2M43_00750 [Mycoplasmoidaceae bacterium]|nr:hypothetical protein [Mycoplasmoidaceae bacterium]